MTQSKILGTRPRLRARMMDRAARRFLGVASRNGSYRIAEGIPIPTRDGFQLSTDLYLPEGRDAAGTILVRGPYGRGGPTGLLNGRVFAAAGYNVLVQSVRGRFGSTDTFQPFIREADDAQDTVSWLRSQPWFDGRLATLGGSYLGFAQWALLSEPPEELRAAVIVVGPHDMSGAMYGTGAFALGFSLGWSEAMAHQETMGPLKAMAGMLTADRRIKGGLDGLPLADAAEPLLGGRAPWYREWLLHPDRSDAFWDGHRYGRALLESEVPTLLVGGWHDIFLEQTIEQYATLRDRHVDVALTVGPWSHMETAAKASGVITRESLDWLDEHLAGGQRTRSSPVRVYVTGANEWREYPQWPPAGPERLYFLDAGGALSESSGEGTSTFTFDPADPTPALGGRLVAPRHAGSKDNRKLEARNDVLTFTSDPLDRDIEILGSPVVELTLSVDNPHADVFVRLCDVDRRGRSRNFVDALLRLDHRIAANDEQHVTMQLDACAHVLRAGHRLRMQVSGGAHPRFSRNLGTDEPLATGRTLASSTHVIHHAASRLSLPVNAGNES